MFELRSENLTGLGGPMGSERVWDNWRRYFPTKEAAKAAAEKDYKKPLKWKKEREGEWRTDDLRYVMYHIKQLVAEK